MKYTRIEKLLVHIKPYEKAAFVSTLIETLGMEHKLSEELFDYMSKYPSITRWREDPEEFMTKVFNACCQEYGVSQKDVMKGKRTSNHVESKRVWMFICEGVMSSDFELIASFIKMDKSSIKYHIAKTRSFIETNKKYFDKVKSIVEALNQEGLYEIPEFFIKEMNYIKNKRR